MHEPIQPSTFVCDGSDDLTASLVERAFQFRGDVTVWTDDGCSVTGYLFNRNASASEPFVQLFEAHTGHEVRIPYGSITQLQFTGRDAASASVQRYEEYQQRQGGLPPIGDSK